MTFTEFEEKNKRYRNNRGQASFLLGPLIIRYFIYRVFVWILNRISNIEKVPIENEGMYEGCFLR